jgi:hypothetical protein
MTAQGEPLRISAEASRVWPVTREVMAMAPAVAPVIPAVKLVAA